MARKDYIVGSGDVFEDLDPRGRPRPWPRPTGAQDRGADRRLTQAAATGLLNVDQPKVSALVHRRLAGFSLDRPVRFLVLLGSDVTIAVKPRSRAMSRARVMVA
jgi:Helix-turn-helix domain